MEEGKKYLVIFNDGERVRDKKLVFKSFSNNFAVFFNPFTRTEESINISNIIRTEEVSKND